VPNLWKRILRRFHISETAAALANGGVCLDRNAIEEFAQHMGRLGVPVPPGEGLNYMAGHHERFRQSMMMIPPDAKDVLEVGTGWPYFFTAMLIRERPSVRVTTISDGQPAAPEPYRIGDDGFNAGPAINFLRATCNIETGTWPVPSDSYDVVLFMEVLEHLAIDPLQVFLEAHRVLRPGGTMFVTTPNIASLEAVAKILLGQSPYNFGFYLPQYGVYGRHNREFIAEEVAALGQCAGFSTKVIETRDVYPLTRDLTPARAALKAFGILDDGFRKQVIFYSGSKMGEEPSAFPPALYMNR
jgi:SAM-dependent methyltransferase